MIGAVIRGERGPLTTDEVAHLGYLLEDATDEPQSERGGGSGGSRVPHPTWEDIERRSLFCPYLRRAVPYIQGVQELNQNDLILEFMLNALRLHRPISLTLFEDRTGLSSSVLDRALGLAEEKGLLEVKDFSIETTTLGKQHLNELLLIFS
jgi:coproporphyrinogen III oxidase-like Fe-S oxidoreductase